jgi:nitroimidazol reductase NimA-like FMN-containing flavoprotein (pyridoxamine 5'-phosphate oxidase superfamily)
MSELSAASVLEDPVAAELLQSTEPARLAYTWTDGTPRVVPIWFHWDGHRLVFGSPADAPKVAVLRERPDVAVTIDRAAQFPYKVLLVRGAARFGTWTDSCRSTSPQHIATSVRSRAQRGSRWWVNSDCAW